MLHENAKLKISTAELLPIAINLLNDGYGSELNLADPILLKDKYTGRKVCIEYHQFVFDAKSEMLEVSSVHARLMEKQKDFVIYFADVKKFMWFEWHLIHHSGYKNHKIDLKNNLKIPMWNFKVSHGHELKSWLADEVQIELQWWQK